MCWGVVESGCPWNDGSQPLNTTGGMTPRTASTASAEVLKSVTVETVVTVDSYTEVIWIPFTPLVAHLYHVTQL